jgi:hypothetical protein
MLRHQMSVTFNVQYVRSCHLTHSANIQYITNFKAFYTLKTPDMKIRAVNSGIIRQMYRTHTMKYFYVEFIVCVEFGVLEKQTIQLY